MPRSERRIVSSENNPMDETLCGWYIVPHATHERRHFMEGLTPTRMVHYVATGNEPYVKDDTRGQCKAAVLVGIEDRAEGVINLQVLWDGYKDLKLGMPRGGSPLSEIPPMTTWLQSVHHMHTESVYDDESLVGSWHWPRDCTLDH